MRKFMSAGIMLVLAMALAESDSAQLEDRLQPRRLNPSEQNRPSERDIVGVWHGRDNQTLNLYGSPDRSVLYDRTMVAGATTLYEKGKGQWSIVGQTIRLEYLVERNLFREGTYGSTSKTATVKVIKDYEFLPPRTLRSKDGTVYTK